MLLWILRASIILTSCFNHVSAFNCSITLCSIPNFCGTGRECYTRPDSCKWECVCTDNVTHELCRTEVVNLSTNPPMTSIKIVTITDSGNTTADLLSNTGIPIMQRTDCLNNYTTNPMPCPSGIPCLYGDCVVDNLTGIIKCDCYPGATGILCNEPCCLDCGPYGVCRVNMADRTQYCNCHPGYTGERCAKPIEDDVSNTKIPVMENADCLSNFTKNAEFCMIPCLYGDCVTDNLTFTTRCACYPGAHGDSCNLPCCLDCGPQGECKVNVADSSPFCSCHPNYTGEGCTTRKQIDKTGNIRVQMEKETWYLWLVGLCVVVLFLLLLLLIVLPYLMWKHRVILILKMVHYFQPYEKQDDRIWDALVLYRFDPVDEEFVLQTLCPTLEKMGFNVTKFRDFTVRETIANITQAVHNSRRTILVMSKSYVKSEFTSFEYRCARQEMLQNKHRIIPILLEDITEVKEKFDTTLKVILNSVACIEWPCENNPKKLKTFWNRLELSMPKKRMVKDEATLRLESVAIHVIDANK